MKKKGKPITYSIQKEHPTHSIVSLVFKLITKRIRPQKKYWLFINNKTTPFYFKYSNNKGLCSSASHKILINFTYKQKNNYNIVTHVKLTKYKTFGINWSSLHLELNHYEVSP